MPEFTWSNRPSELPHSNIPILRVKPGFPIRGTILSHDIQGAELHFGGRSVPHTDPSDLCDGCQRGQPRRWEGYLALWSQGKGSIGVLAIPPGAVPQFAAYLELHGTLRGAVLVATRAGNKPNGRIVAEIARGELAMNQLPREPDVCRILAHIWGLDRTEVSQRRFVIDESAYQEIARRAEELDLPPLAVEPATAAGGPTTAEQRAEMQRRIAELRREIRGRSHDRTADQPGRSEPAAAGHGD
ncbi:hypothetical protein [Planctellipticum variicoloris]|uniref:hypothetical protein n=1 Tax=Planctellipticum variicoloris TaxID=3064265 RepID=UPI003013844B|nr:hypothetical protein SH412_002789 [Planctomycetaceae bacterium SH412]